MCSLKGRQERARLGPCAPSRTQASKSSFYSQKVAWSPSPGLGQIRERRFQPMSTGMYSNDRRQILEAWRKMHSGSIPSPSKAWQNSLTQIAASIISSLNSCEALLTSRINELERDTGPWIAGGPDECWRLIHLRVSTLSLSRWLSEESQSRAKATGASPKIRLRKSSASSAMDAAATLYSQLMSSERLIRSLVESNSPSALWGALSLRKYHQCSQMLSSLIERARTSSGLQTTPKQTSRRGTFPLRAGSRKTSAK